ncbi:MAG: lamin tail domain-containing protein [Candidatus Cryptobacteroides sp.]
MKKMYLAALLVAAISFSACLKDEAPKDENKDDIENPGDNGNEENPGDNENEDPKPEEIAVVLNEINGDIKFIELYNKSDEEVVLDGWFLLKDEDATDETISDLEAATAAAKWTGTKDVKVPAKGHLVLWSYKSSDPRKDEADAALIINSGLSDKQAVKLVLLTAEGKVADSFVRGDETCEFGTTILPQNKEADFSRVPDGTGEWVYAVPTLGEANGEKTGEIEHTPVE